MDYRKKNVVSQPAAICPACLEIFWNKISRARKHSWVNCSALSRMAKSHGNCKLYMWLMSPHTLRCGLCQPVVSPGAAKPISNCRKHYNDVIMGAVASPITILNIVYSNVDSGTDQRKHQSSASLAFVRGIHRGPVNSPHKWPVTRKMFPFYDVMRI